MAVTMVASRPSISPFFVLRKARAQRGAPLCRSRSSIGVSEPSLRPSSILRCIDRTTLCASRFGSVDAENEEDVVMRASCEREAFDVRLSSIFSGIFSSLALPALGRGAKLDLGLFMPLQFTLRVRLGFLMQLKGIFS